MVAEMDGEKRYLDRLCTIRDQQLFLLKQHQGRHAAGSLLRIFLPVKDFRKTMKLLFSILAKNSSLPVLIMQCFIATMVSSSAKVSYLLQGIYSMENKTDGAKLNRLTFTILKEILF
jgi:hypothetical protein